MIYICNFHVLNHLLLIYICKLHWNLFGGFIAIQTISLRFTFDESAFSLKKESGEKLSENIVVGGENRWAYKSFVNWQFLPSEEFPILVYFKETQVGLLFIVFLFI